MQGKKIGEEYPNFLHYIVALRIIFWESGTIKTKTHYKKAEE